MKRRGFRRLVSLSRKPAGRTFRTPSGVVRLGQGQALRNLAPEAKRDKPGMNMERIRAALDLALHLHSGQTWPGSRIPYVAHALEVACRVATLGGAEDTILVALLHDVRRDGNKTVLLESVRKAFGDRVAGLLDACWSGHLLPHAGWGTWSPEKTPEDPELQLLVGCDALCCFRNVLLDWQALAHLWDEIPKDDVTDRLWLQHQAELPQACFLTRGHWVPNSAEHHSATGIRQELMDFFRGWLGLPLRHEERAFAYPSLALAYQGDAWSCWVDAQELVPYLEGWGLPGIAQEMQIVLGRLNGLPGMARAGFLRQSARDTEILRPEVAKGILQKMTMVELMIVLSNQRSRLVRSFRPYVPKSLQGFFPPGQFWPEPSSLADPILLHWLGEVAEDGRVLELPPLGRNDSPANPANHAAFPEGDRYRKALSLLFEMHAGEPWPNTTIPYIFHSLEVSSLVLTAGWDEDTAVLAMLHDLPRTEDSLHKVGLSLGSEATAQLSEFWRLRGLVHRVPGPCQTMTDIEFAHPSLGAVALMDATSLLRFVAEDYQAVAENPSIRNELTRGELAKRLQFFKGFLYGKPVRNIAETVLIGTRFGPARSDWQSVADSVMPKPSQDFLSYDAQIGDGAEEIMTLLARLEIPQPELVGLICLLESMEEPSLSVFMNRVGFTNAVVAFQDPTWDRVRKIVQAKMDLQQKEKIYAKFHDLLPAEAGAVRSAQKAFFAVAARIRGCS